ncbi:hypothetical protein [Larkinella soli]|uniref:hypothetical protein n=1 Tax=Larkinella soli TaxID=1770527 RepID=UPI000FFCC2E0|nr:hypothetical protein [Larkinella soli]
MERLANLLSNSLRSTSPADRNAVLIPMLTGFLFLGITLAVVWLWASGQPAETLWVSLTLWSALLVAGCSFVLLTLGERP